MTGAKNFTIDSTLAPADADAAFGDLGNWLASDSPGLLDISDPRPEPELPTQVALQLLFVAAAELARRGEAETRIGPDAAALCLRLSGESSLAGFAGPLVMEPENV